MPRHFLFLQGMPCAFFPRIAERLRADGARTTRINLCLGDQLFWSGPHALNYRGSYRAWPNYIAAFMRREGVTDLILLGEQRYYHREAVAAAQALGIAVTVTDFGYIRPDWITFERDGMSGGSHFPRTAEGVRALAARSPKPDWPARFVDRSLTMARSDLLQNFATLFGAPLFPYYQRSDRRPHTLIYTAASAARLLSNWRMKAKANAFVEMLKASAQRYYLFPLQLNFDFQIIAYSRYRNMEEAITEVMNSFAAYASADAMLVMKEHPWDPAIIDWERMVRNKASGMGLSARVHYLRGGVLDDLVAQCAGVVTINSTAGIRALQIGRPLKALGQAVYDIPGLTNNCRLDEFWSQGVPPDPALVQDFLAALVGTVLIRGVFFEKTGLAQAVQEATHRLLANKVGEPLPAVNS